MKRTHVHVLSGDKTVEIFQRLMEERGFFTYSFQSGHEQAATLSRGEDFRLLPDVLAVSFEKNAAVLCEVKRKFATPKGSYGFKDYEIEHAAEVRRAMGLSYLFVVYDWTEDAWHAQTIDTLVAQKPYAIPTRFTGHIGGEKKMTRPFYYYPKALFVPLDEILMALSGDRGGETQRK